MNTLIRAARTSLSTLTISAFALSMLGGSFAQLAPIAHAADSVTTVAASSITSSDATLNGINQSADATDSSFWASTSPFVTTSTTLPAGVFSTPDLGAVAADAAFSAPLSSITGILPVTASTTYYFAAWTEVDGTWSPGAVLSFNTNIPVTGISLNESSNTLTVGGATDQLTATIAPADATDQTVTYSSDNSAVASVDASSGLITAVAAGSATITATADDTTNGTFTASDAITVVNPTSAPITNAATSITASDAMLNGMNGSLDASDSSFWVSTSTFSTASSAALPSGVFSTPLLGAVAANAAFSGSLSSVTGLPAVTADTTYYFAAWTEVDGTWSPGAVLSFTTANAAVLAAPTVASLSPSTGTTAGGDSVTITGTGFTGATAVNFGASAAAAFSVINDSTIMATSSAGTGIADVTVTTPEGVSATSTADQFTYVLTGTVVGDEGTLAVTSITPVQTSATADGTYADGWSYLFNITVPVNEPNLAMKFADWIDAATASTLPVANNMEISSAQAVDTSPVVITAANTYSSPALDITGDLSPSTPGMQVQVLVQVAVPINTVNGSYTTSYGVQTLP